MGIWIGVGGALALAYWSHWLITTRRLRRGWYVPVAIALASVPLLVLLAAARTQAAFADLGAVSPAERQLALAGGIRQAMVPTVIALGVLFAWLLWLGVATARRRRPPPPA